MTDESNFALAPRLAPELAPAPEPTRTLEELGMVAPELDELEPASAPEPDELDDAEVARRLDELTPVREEPIMTTLSPESIVRDIFGKGWHFERGFSTSGDPYALSPGAGHHGWDVSAKRGTPVYALAGGKVSYAANEGANRAATRAFLVNGGGNAVSIDVGAAGRLDTQYLHLDSIAVTPGQTVAPGDLIGTVGDSGNTTGPHLHFDLLDHGTKRWVNPHDFLAGLASSGWSPFSRAVAAQKAQAQAAQASLNTALSRQGAPAPTVSPSVPSSAASSGAANLDLVTVGMIVLLGIAIIALVLLAGPRSETPA